MSANFRNPGEQNIPIGTVGADKVQGSRLTDAQKLQNNRVTKGWKFLSLSKSAASIAEAAKRLEQEMEAEAKYWEDVLSIGEKGWAVSYATRTSQYERQDNKKSDGTLAVRFGFSECKRFPWKQANNRRALITNLSQLLPNSVTAV